MTGRRPNKPQSSNLATQRHKPSQRSTSQGGDRPPNPPNLPRRGGNNGREDEPSPWLQHPHDVNPDPDPTAGFIEYLRWMRLPDHEYKDSTKVQILQLAEERADYRDRLRQMTDRTRQIAGASNCFEVKCSWRIRVGGHRGPESILLPAFDALGMPYIPSSTLRGIARTQAIREFINQENLSWQDAEQKVVAYFGSLEADEQNKAGKVVFLDAYPLPSLTGGLSMDIATNIWGWQENIPTYDSPNPNPFFSLKETSFLIGLKLVIGCQDLRILQCVKAWLIAGLEKGVGSQVNTGYGEIVTSNRQKTNAFFRVKFNLEGQLIHGPQKFKNLRTPYERDQDGQLRTDSRGKLKPSTTSISEVRASAFKSMLRYWFRAFALGVLEAEQVEKLWEPKLFGSITPQTWGWVRVEICNGKTLVDAPQTKNEPCGEQEGTLVLSFSPAAPQEKHQAIQKLFKNLTWMMFHLGGVGQGARRPCYSRKGKDRNNPKPPYYRGSTLFPPEDAFWELPDRPREFCQIFQQRLRAFYQALAELSGEPCNTIHSCGQVSDDSWFEVVDNNCRIVVCTGSEEFEKPYALSVLHEPQFKQRNQKGELVYNPNLCGTTRPIVRPSPIWISDLGNYQVVTIFGATQNPRARYLAALQGKINIFPLPQQ